MLTSLALLAGTSCIMIAREHAQADAETADTARAICVLSDHMPVADPAYVDRLLACLRGAGLPARAISCTDLADPAVLATEHVDTLVLTDSARFPAIAFDSLTAFLRAGGNLVLMGPRPFSRPLFRAGDRWQTPAQFASTLAQTQTGRATLFDFEDGNTDRWQRGASNRDAPTRISTAPGRSGQALRLALRDVTWYDVVGARIETDIPAAHNALCLWAKADPDTPQIFVEVTEIDGTRWSRAVDAGPEWSFHVLPQSTFLFKADGSPTGRGKESDSLDIARSAKVTVGLAKDRTPAVGQAHTIEIDDIGTATVPPGFTQAEKGLSFRGAFNDYTVYDLAGTVRVQTHAEQDWLRTPCRLDRGVNGLSAVGFAAPHESVFVPLLAAEDTQGRVQGWAAGMLVHHAGPYTGSQWGLFGVEDRSFYHDEQVLRIAVELLRGFRTGRWVERARRAEQASALDRLALTTPGPPPLTIRNGHFAYPDGRRFFMIGVNFWNSFDTFHGGGIQWDAGRLIRDFERMESAGINAIRLHGFNRFALADKPHRLDTLLELCRRHRIYILPGLGLGKHAYLRDGKSAMQEEARRVARLLKDESVVLGYDLQNEPYWWEIARAPFDNTTLSERFPVPKSAWTDYFRSLNVCEGNWTSTFPGLEGTLPVPKERRLRQGYENVNAIMGTWIGWLVEAIRAEDQIHPITVGYNTILDCLPANEQLDFVSHHVYEPPESLEHVKRNLTTLDRLRRIWPDRPVTLGEFGYSSGDLIGGKTLDVHTQSVGEIVHWLYALANDYDGVMKWQLCDADPAYQWRFATWRRKDPEAKRLRERRFGMFWPDGTPEGRAKPIAHATRFLRDCVDAGLADGELELRTDPNLIGTGYVFRGKNVLFVGGRGYDSPELQLESAIPVNVMLRWTGTSLTILATADATVLLRPDAFVSGKRLHAAAGGHGAPGVEELGDAWVRLQLLEGQSITLQARQ